MPGRVLKNFDLYRDKILHYIEACEVDVVYADVDGDGVFVPSQRKIKIDKDLPESTEIATLLHEVAHLFDDSLHKPRTMRRLDKAYTAYYSGRASVDQKALVMACEKRAWLYGRSIAKKLRIPLGKWFDEEETEALQGYSETE